MRIERVNSAEPINEVLNHPSVRPDVADVGKGSLDITPTISNPSNVCLMGEHGGMVFLQALPGVYEVHTASLPKGRGKWIYEFSKAAVRYVFTHTDAYEVTTRIPREHHGARALAIANGMTLEFSIENGCRWRETMQPCDIYSFRIQDWIRKADELIETGQWFHDRLHAEAQRLGVTDAPHEDMPWHDRYVGAAVEMAFSGQAQKGVFFYNRASLLGRHSVVELVSIEPPIIASDIGMIVFRDNDVEVQRRQ